MQIINRLNIYCKEKLLRADLGSLGWHKSLLVRTLRIVYATWKEFTDVQLSLRAMGLVYTTLLSLVPLLAVSFSVLKAFGVHNKIEPFLFSVLEPLGPKGAEITSRIIEFVNNIKVGILGSIGLAFLFYTVISLLQKIENAFNSIWKVSSSRSFARRFSDYTSVMLVGPLLVFAAMGLTATVMRMAYWYPSNPSVS
jgi:membrane protein